MEFYDYSVKIPFDSSDAAYIRRKIREKIQPVHVTVCLIGRLTHTSTWVNWELRESKEFGKVLMGVRIGNTLSDTVPKPLLEYNAPILPWDIDKIVTAIEREAVKAGY